MGFEHGYNSISYQVRVGSELGVIPGLVGLACPPIRPALRDSLSLSLSLMASSNSNPADVHVVVPSSQPASGGTFHRRVWCRGVSCLIVCGIVLAACCIVSLLAVIATPSMRIPAQPEFGVDFATASSFCITPFPSQVSADFDLTLSAINPNQDFAFRYFNIEASLVYGSDDDRTTIAHGWVPSFRNGRHKTSTVEARLVAEKSFLYPGTNSQMMNDLLVKKALVLDLNVIADVSVKDRLFMLKKRRLEMQCKDITIWFATPDAGFMTGPTASCHITDQ